MMNQVIKMFDSHNINIRTLRTLLTQPVLEGFASFISPSKDMGLPGQAGPNSDGRNLCGDWEAISEELQEAIELEEVESR